MASDDFEYPPKGLEVRAPNDVTEIVAIGRVLREEIAKKFGREVGEKAGAFVDAAVGIAVASQVVVKV